MYAPAKLELDCFRVAEYSEWSRFCGHLGVSHYLSSETSTSGLMARLSLLSSTIGVLAARSKTGLLLSGQAKNCRIYHPENRASLAVRLQLCAQSADSFQGRGEDCLCHSRSEGVPVEDVITIRFTDESEHLGCVLRQ